MYSQTPVMEAIKLSEAGDKLSFPRPALGETQDCHFTEGKAEAEEG